MEINSYIIYAAVELGILFQVFYCDQLLSFVQQDIIFLMMHSVYASDEAIVIAYYRLT